MRITALQPQATNPDRINIFVDGQFLIGVNALLVLQMELAVEQELSAEQLEQLRYEEALQQAVSRALNFLSFRPRSRQEVRNYLRRKSTPLELIDAALEKLNQLEVVNDQAFASFWIENRERFSPRGSQALKSELRMKGVEREIVEELIDDEQDEDRALRAARKKALLLVRIPTMDFPTFRTRLSAFLQRRRFNYEITNRVVRTLWTELKGTEADED